MLRVFFLSVLRLQPLVCHTLHRGEKMHHQTFLLPTSGCTVGILLYEQHRDHSKQFKDFRFLA